MIPQNLLERRGDAERYYVSLRETLQARTRVPNSSRLMSLEALRAETTNLIKSRLAELPKISTRQIREQIMLRSTGEEQTLEEWTQKHVPFSKLPANEYPLAETVIFADKEKLYSQVPDEVEVFTRVSSSIMSDGDPEAYAQMAQFYLDLLNVHLHIAVGGLSVGGEILRGINHAIPIWDEIRIADPGIWHPSNLDRVDYPYDEEGKPKGNLRATQTHHQIPRAYVRQVDEGVTPENVFGFLNGAVLALDEMDRVLDKIMFRRAARELRVPVFMFTDAGEQVIREIRRFDQDPNLPLFACISDQDLEQKIAQYNDASAENKNARFAALATAIVGPDNIPPGYRLDMRGFAEGRIAVLPQPRETVLTAAKEAIITTRQFLMGEDLPEISIFPV